MGSCLESTLLKKTKSKETMNTAVFKQIAVLSVAISSTVFAGHGHQYYRKQQQPAGNIAEELTKAGATTLVDFVVKAGLAETLSGVGPFTVFAPDNYAFARLPADLVATLNTDTELLKKVLLYHVVSGKVMSEDITNDAAVDTVEGTMALRTNVYLQSKFYDGFVTVNGKRVKKADIPADNGVIHMMNRVIYPFPVGNISEVVTGVERLSTLLSAVVTADLAETLSTGGPFTVFAPTNDAFAKIPAEDLDALLADKEALTRVLLRHVVPGTFFFNGITWDILDTAGGVEEDMIATQRFKGGVVKVVSSLNGTRTDARALEADIIATNGVIHAIDTVI